MTRERGQTLVEFALVIPLVLLLFMGVFDFGRAFFAYNNVSNAAREGSRTAIVNQNVTDITNRAADQATSLGLNRTNASCSTESGVCVSFKTADLSADCSSSLAPGCVAIVTAKYTFHAITPIISVIFSSLVVSSTSKQPIESVCTGGGCPIP